MEEQGLTNVVKKMGKIIDDFTCLGSNLSLDLGKLSETINKFSEGLSNRENFEIFELIQKISNEDPETLSNLIKEGNKEKISILLSKYSDNQKIINVICESMNMWKETMNLENNLTSKITEIFKDSKLSEDLTSLGKSFMNCDLDSSTIKDIVNQVTEKIGTRTGIPDLKETVDKVMNENDAEKIINSLGNITVKISDRISLKCPNIRKGLVDETFQMIEQHKKISHDINSLVKTLSSSEIQILKTKCGGELPLEFRLRMMENTIQHLDQTLKQNDNDGLEKTGIEELSEKIDDIAVNIELLINKLSKIIQ